MPLDTKVLAAPIVLFVSMVSIKGQDRESSNDDLSARYIRILLSQPYQPYPLERCAEHFRKGDGLNALLDRLEERKEQEPDSVDLTFLIGRVHELMDARNLALLAYQRCEALAPENSYPTMYRGLLLNRLGRSDESIAALSQALEKVPDEESASRITLTLIELHLGADQNDDAWRVVSTAQERFGDDPEFLENLGSLLERYDRWDLAGRVWEKLARNAGPPERKIRARLSLAGVLERLGRLDEAMETLGDILDRVEPQSWIAQEVHTRIESHFLQHESRLALREYYQDRAKDSKGRMTPHLDLIRVLIRLRDSHAAIDALTELLTIAPSATEPHAQLIRLLSSTGQWERAAQEARALIQKAPSFDDGMVLCGETLIEARRRDRDSSSSLDTISDLVLPLWEAIAARHDGDALWASRVAELCASAYFTLRPAGRVEVDPMDSPFFAAALRHYRRAVLWTPSESRFRQAEGELLYRVGKTDEAMQAWISIVEPPRDTARSYEFLAAIYRKHDLLPQALACLQKATELTPEDFTRRETWITNLWHQGSIELALDECLGLRSLAHNHQELGRALALEINIVGSNGTLNDYRLALARSYEEGTLEFADVWLLGLVYSGQGEWDDAIDVYRRALEIGEGSQVLTDELASLFVNARRFDEALSQLDHLLSTDTVRAENYLDRIANAQVSLSVLERLTPAARHLTEDDRASPRAYRLLAELLERRGEIEACRHVWSKALALFPNRTELRRDTVLFLERRFGEDEAWKELWAYLESKASISDKRHLLLSIAREDGGPSTEDYLERLHRYEGDPRHDRWSRLCRVFLLVYEGRDEEARPIVDKLLAEGEDDRVVLEEALSLHVRTQDWKAAARTQERLAPLSDVRSSQITLARFYLRAEEYVLFEQMWREIAPSCSESTPIFKEACRFLHSHRFHAASKLASIGLDAFPNDWRLDLLSGIAALCVDDRACALEAFERLERMRPESFSATGNQNWAMAEPATWEYGPQLRKYQIPKSVFQAPSDSFIPNVDFGNWAFALRINDREDPFWMPLWMAATAWKPGKIRALVRDGAVFFNDAHVARGLALIFLYRLHEDQGDAETWLRDKFLAAGQDPVHILDVALVRAAMQQWKIAHAQVASYLQVCPGAPLAHLIRLRANHEFWEKVPLERNLDREREVLESHRLLRAHTTDSERYPHVVWSLEQFYRQDRQEIARTLLREEIEESSEIPVLTNLIAAAHSYEDSMSRSRGLARLHEIILTGSTDPDDLSCLVCLLLDKRFEDRHDLLIELVGRLLETDERIVFPLPYVAVPSPFPGHTPILCRKRSYLLELAFSRCEGLEKDDELSAALEDRLATATSSSVRARIGLALAIVRWWQGRPEACLALITELGSEPRLAEWFGLLEARVLVSLRRYDQVTKALGRTEHGLGGEFRSPNTRTELENLIAQILDHEDPKHASSALLLELESPYPLDRVRSTFSLDTSKSGMAGWSDILNASILRNDSTRDQIRKLADAALARRERAHEPDPALHGLLTACALLFDDPQSAAEYAPIWLQWENHPDSKVLWNCDWIIEALLARTPTFAFGERLVAAAFRAAVVSKNRSWQRDLFETWVTRLPRDNRACAARCLEEVWRALDRDSRIRGHRSPTLAKVRRIQEWIRQLPDAKVRELTYPLVTILDREGNNISLMALQEEILPAVRSHMLNAPAEDQRRYLQASIDWLFPTGRNEAPRTNLYRPIERRMGSTRLVDLTIDLAARTGSLPSLKGLWARHAESESIPLRYLQLRVASAIDPSLELGEAEIHRYLKGIHSRNGDG